MVAAGQDAGAGLRRRFWLQGEPDQCRYSPMGPVPRVPDGQRVGFSREGGEGGRCPGVAFPGCSDHVLAAAGKRQEADVFSSRSASMLSAAPMATICALGARWPPFLLN